MLAALHAKPREALQGIEKALGAKGGGVEAFLEALWAAEATLGEQFPRLDKKREKAVQANSRAAWRDQLLAEGQPVVVLQLSVLLLHLDISGAVR